ncbi:MAG: gamma-glutamylcyclotransferase [Hyphomicrobiaceae bacterium]
MSFAHDVFRHLPALRKLIIAPEKSTMRLSDERFAELDAQAQAESWPPGWRMEHDAREANRHAVLSGRLDRDLWVFAYGSLIWDPAVKVGEFLPGSLAGWRRRFCMRLEGGRATRDRPGLMAALDEGGHCDGVVFRIPAALVDQETNYMWRREMFAGAYRPIFQEIATPQGSVKALVFVIEQSNRRYVPGIPKYEAARIIATAEGDLGPNFDYLELLVRNLDELGIKDDDMRQLHVLAAEYRGKLASRA